MRLMSQSATSKARSTEDIHENSRFTCRHCSHPSPLPLLRPMPAERLQQHAALIEGQVCFQLLNVSWPWPIGRHVAIPPSVFDQFREIPAGEIPVVVAIRYFLPVGIETLVQIRLGEAKLLEHVVPRK